MLKVLDFPTGVSTNIKQEPDLVDVFIPKLVGQRRSSSQGRPGSTACYATACGPILQTYRRFDALHEAYDYMTCNVIHHGFSWRFPSHTDLNQNSRLTFVQTSFDVGSEIITAHSTWWPVLDGPRGNTTLVWLVSIPSRNTRSNQFQHKKTRLHPRHIPYPIFLEMMCP